MWKNPWHGPWHSRSSPVCSQIWQRFSFFCGPADDNLYISISYSYSSFSLLGAEAGSGVGDGVDLPLSLWKQVILLLTWNLTIKFNLYKFILVCKGNFLAYWITIKYVSRTKQRLKNIFQGLPILQHNWSKTFSIILYRHTCSTKEVTKMISALSEVF